MAGFRIGFLIISIAGLHAYTGAGRVDRDSSGQLQSRCDRVQHTTTDSSSSLHCCGNRTYDNVTEICCRDDQTGTVRVHGVPDPAAYDCCGLEVYKKTTHSCNRQTLKVKADDATPARRRRSANCGEGGCCDGKFITIGREVSPRLGGLRACCGSKLFNITTEECCSEELEVVAGRGEMCCGGKAVKASNDMVCCGQKAINLHQSRCCYKYGNHGRVIKQAVYNVTTEQCCGGDVINASVPCCNQRWPMNDKTQVCCPYHGPQNKTNPHQNACCEDQWLGFIQLYNSKYEVCLHNEVKTRDSACPEGQSLCSTSCYNPDTHICCPDSSDPGVTGRIYSKLTDGDKCCADRAYFIWSQSCCDGRLYNTSLMKCCCGGRIPYDPFAYRCLERKKRPVACKVVGCPAEIVNKDQFQKIRELLLTNTWLVAKAKAMVKRKLDADFVHFSGSILQPKHKRNIRIKVVKDCIDTGNKGAVWFLLKLDEDRQDKSIIIASDTDYIFKKKSVFKRIKACTKLLMRGKPLHKNKKCRILLGMKKD